jgi:hypothetical protein
VFRTWSGTRGLAEKQVRRQLITEPRGQLADAAYATGKARLCLAGSLAPWNHLAVPTA